MSQLMKAKIGQQVRPYKKGGEVKHDDEAADRALIKKAVKKEALTGKKSGGKMRKGGMCG